MKFKAMENLTIKWKAEYYLRPEGPRYWVMELEEGRSRHSCWLWYLLYHSMCQPGYHPSWISGKAKDTIHP